MADWRRLDETTWTRTSPDGGNSGLVIRAEEALLIDPDPEKEQPDIPGARVCHTVHTTADHGPGRHALSVGGVRVELIPYGPARAAVNTAVWIPADRVLFTGDLVSSGVHPALCSGSFSGWRDACAHLARLRPAAVVPGEGPVTDTTGISDFRDYLDHVRARAEAAHHDGVPAVRAARGLPLGRWQDWSSPENLVTTVAAVHRELGDPSAPSPEEACALAGAAAGECARPPRLVPIPPIPRIPPIPPSERDERITRLLEPAQGEGALFDGHDRRPVLNILATLARHPRLFQRTVPLAQFLTDGLLPARDRELAVLRTAWWCGAVYQWAHHHDIALAAGVSDAEIERVARSDPDWQGTPHEAALLRAVDELHRTATVSDGTWHVLKGHYDEAELIELVSLIGEYHKVSFLLNALRTPLDEWAEPRALPLPRGLVGGPPPPAPPRRPGAPDCRSG